MKIRILLSIVFIGFIAVVFISGCEKKQPTASEDQSNPTATVTDEVIEQTICPVMGNPINKDVFVEYKGKKVYFCCPGCEDDFNKDPEKYISKLPQFKSE